MITIMISIRARPRNVAGYERSDDGLQVVGAVVEVGVFAGYEVAV